MVKIHKVEYKVLNNLVNIWCDFNKSVKNRGIKNNIAVYSITKDDNNNLVYTALDNSTNDCNVEVFNNEEVCKKWLRNEIQRDDIENIVNLVNSYYMEEFKKEERFYLNENEPLSIINNIFDLAVDNIGDRENFEIEIKYDFISEEFKYYYFDTLLYTEKYNLNDFVTLIELAEYSDFTSFIQNKEDILLNKLLK